MQLHSKNKIALNIENETALLKTVVLGIANDFGSVPKIEDCYDPSSKYYVKNNIYPKQEDITSEIEEFFNILNKYDVEILRPKNVVGLNQVFARDLGFVIEDHLFISNVIEDRAGELPAISDVVSKIPMNQVLKLPNDLIIEGGDVTVTNDHIFIGCSNNLDMKKFKVARTNLEAVAYLANKFPNKKVVGLELYKSDEDKDENTLHLDCCFQPIGLNKAIVATDSFKHKSDVDYIENLYGKDHLFYLTQEEKNMMNSNVFSISTEIVVSDVRFERLNNWMTSFGIKVETVNYKEVSKMGGLFRCSTLPLIRA